MAIFDAFTSVSAPLTTTRTLCCFSSCGIILQEIKTPLKVKVELKLKFCMQTLVIQHFLWIFARSNPNIRLYAFLIS